MHAHVHCTREYLYAVVRAYTTQLQLQLCMLLTFQSAGYPAEFEDIQSQDMCAIDRGARVHPPRPARAMALIVAHSISVIL